MNARVSKFVVGLFVALLALTMVTGAAAQDTSATLSGTVTASSGAVASAQVSLKNTATQQTMRTVTDSSGRYTLPNITAGDYELSVSADGFSTSTVAVTIASGAVKTQDVSLGPALSLSDLGFSSAQIQGSAQQQALLDKRSHMLKIHQRLGLIAAAPMIASVATSFGAGGRSTSSSDRYLHMALGAATADLYFTSAYFAIRAPKIPGTQTRGQIRAHKILAWIHGPGMILTPILGGIAFSQKSKGQRVHGIASAHGPVAIVTASAYAAAILSVSIKF
jgi:Carboxypeptidase regulatory-like domain